MNVLILGGHGFIGCHVSNILKFQGHNVSVVDCYHQYHIFPDWEYQPVLEQRKEWANADAVHMGRIEDEHFLEHAFARATRHVQPRGRHASRFPGPGHRLDCYASGA